MNDKKLKHLEFIQNIITRMNTDSFLIKGWMITLVSALFALAAKDSNVKYVFVTYLAIPIFWGLDAFYLSQERKFRDLYDLVRIKSEEEIDFSMITTESDKNEWVTVIFSKTVWPLYAITIVITLLAIYLLRHF